MQPGDHGLLLKFGWTVLVLLAGLCLATLSDLAAIPVFPATAAFALLHSASEIFAIVVALLIFSSSYHTLNQQQPAGAVFLACAFLGVGLLDFFHILSYPETADFLSAGPNHRGVIFWLASRFLAATTLLVYALPISRPPAGQTPHRRLILLACLGYVLLCNLLALLDLSWLPASLVGGYEPNRFKLFAGWLLIAIHLVALAALLKQRHRLPAALLHFLAPALVLLMAGEFFFIISKDSSGNLNLLGHAYRVLAYLLIYRAIFLENIQQPYLRLEAANQKISFLDYALDQVEEAVYLADENGRFHYVNEGACHTLGYQREELLNMGVLDIDQDLRAPVWAEHRQLIKQNGPQLFVGHYRARDGRIFPAEISASYFVYKGRGYILGLVRDIQERLRMELELAHSHAGLLEAQRIARLGSWEWNISAGTISWSDEVYRLFGISRRGFTPTYDIFLDYVHADDREAVQKAINEALENNRPYDIEHRVVRADGRLIWVQEKGEVARNSEGRPLRMYGTVQDITERKEMEARELQADKMAAMGLMASGIAHDFNNLLTPIMMHTQMLLQNTGEGSSLRHSLQQVNKAAERAAALVRQILNFSRQGRHEPLLTRLSLIIKEAIKFFRTSMPANITIKQEINTERDSLSADPTQLLQVIMNLGINAMHAIGDQEGTITIRLDESPPPEQEQGGPAERVWLKLTVTDTGSGIAPEHFPRLFDPFFTTKEKGQGTGMGLPVVHGIVTRHGGTIKANSEPGNGAIFEVLFPGLSAAGAEESADTQPIIGGSERLLLVDDDPAVLEAEAATLALLGYQVTTAPGGPEALEILRAQPEAFDLLITDYNMPRLKGSELALAAGELRSGLPIILCTGYTGMIDESTAEALGITALLLKPLCRDEFAAAIRQALDNGADPGKK